MSLSSALNVAQTALGAKQTEAAVLSRNIANASQAGYTRKSAMLSTIHSSSGSSGGLYVQSIARAANSALYTNLITSTSAGVTREAYLEGVNRLSWTIGDPEHNLSPAAALGDLETAFQQYSAKPQDTVLANEALVAAKDLVTKLNQSTEAVQAERARSDGAIANSVEKINILLSDIEAFNQEVLKGADAGNDVTDAMDSRDRAVLQLSEEIGIHTEVRGNNDLIITTDSGVMLFETTARSVEFTPTHTFVAGTVGNAVVIDGVPVAGSGATMPISEGRIVGLMAVRDEVSVTYQMQLDEMARGLVEAFAEPGGTGIFTYPGAPAIPPSGIAVDGLAASIEVDPAVDPDQGGVLERLRDGVNHNYNPAGNTGYSERLTMLVGKLDAPTTFDAGTEVDPTNSLKAFSASSTSWLEGIRKNADADAERQSITMGRASEALSNATGVNIDEEMQTMLSIERSYAATARLINTVNKMMDEILRMAD